MPDKEMICPYDGTPAEWVNNSRIYGKSYGKSYMCWLCPKCGAYVGCHQNTRRPLGTMANRELRNWRMHAHAHIDPLWKDGENHISRGAVYAILAEHFGRHIHIGESDIETCKKIIELDILALRRK